MSHTPRWKPICPKLQRVQDRAGANRNRHERFTSPAHLLTEEALARAYRRLRARVAAGIDGRTKAPAMEKGLSENLAAFQARLKAG
jgi:hypothetical protein